MTKKDCIVGEYYAWYEGKAKNPWCIIKYTNPKGYQKDKHIIGGPIIDGGLTRFDRKDGGLHVDGRDIRIATPEQRAWLDACISEKKFIKKDKFKKLLKPLPLFN